MLRPMNTLISVFAHAMIFLVSFTLAFAHYSSASQDTSTDVTEDIDGEDISALIHPRDSMLLRQQSHRSGNSTMALGLLVQIFVQI